MTSSDESRRFDVLAIGGAAVDLVLKLDRLPSHDDKILADLVGYLPGGPASNFACAASRLGLRVASCFEVGDDEPGRLVLDDLARFGVDTSLVRVMESARSNFTVILSDPSGEKAIVVVPVLPDVHLLNTVEGALHQTRLMYLMPSDHEQFLALARLAHRNGTEVMIDVEPTIVAGPDSLPRLLSEVDIASFNANGFKAATGKAPTAEAAHALLDLGPHTVVITLGASWSLAVTQTESAQAPGHRVPVADTTGAGDTYSAAFVWATLRGLPLRERVCFAGAAAAISVTGMGPRGKLPTVQEVRAFMRTHCEVQAPAL